MFSAFRTLFNRPTPVRSHAHRVPARNLADERDSDFFTWFHLEPDGEPVPVREGSRHRFRPSGQSFRTLVALDLRVDEAGGIRSVRLCLDRSFVSGPDDAFARDLSKSFLKWALDDAARQRAAPLIANIGDFAAANGHVITAGALPPPPPDASGAYAVFAGDGDAATLTLGTAMLKLVNMSGQLVIDVVQPD
jgi:hypothetical protein